ncbi:MAG TPA: hypothetical protein VF033_06170 [Steroidobacteraceae bacterium]
MAATTDTATWNVSGKVFEAASKRGVDGVIVTAWHTASSSGGSAGLDGLLKGAVRLGSVPTQEISGDFSLDVEAPGTLNLLIVVTAPEDEKGAAGKVLYYSDPPRMGASRKEHFQIGLQRATLEKFSLATDTTAKDSIATYREGRQFERDFGAGVASFHEAEVVDTAKARVAMRAELKAKLMTDPAVAQLPGQVVADGEAIKPKMDQVAAAAVASANEKFEDGRGVPVNLYLTPEDQETLAPFFAEAVGGVATIPESVIRPILFRSQGADNPGALIFHDNPIAKFCSERTVEETCAEIHTGMTPDEGPDHGGDTGGGSGGGAGGGSGGGTEVTELTDEALLLHTARLLADARSPDEVLNPELAQQRPDRTTVENAVDDFSLRKGPADTPAFYDFHSLQVAFDHVWKFLIDEDLVTASHAVDTRFRQKTGTSLAAVFPHHWADLVSSIDVSIAIPQDIPAEVSAQFDITREEWTDMSPTRQSKLTAIARELEKGCEGTVKVSVAGFTIKVPAGKMGTLNCERRRQDLREQGERLIDSVRHDDYYTLHKTLRDLHDRMNGNYEFTVFAADPNTQAVNFGLLNTYRMQMAPINYQAGRLVKTIPLSPKEERKYSLKVTRTEKQARKEAIKNNSSLTHEQSSTARAEAEIMRKAQNKTNFGLSADGSYNIGISKGKSTTTFGIEAQQESSENRKDFREAVLKAVQDYKEERTVEVETEETVGTEYNESGTIVNPNDELSATYLFYELQRRYRVSEQLYRVMPVVLVAQEVPAPHQITEAWVIAHDWIINRVLLDDSFRPCLQYLANKSVGDDFALRELRKNLRQQRNLVETLRIELSIASNEAENRYRALESAIEKRIGEEHAEKTDGWFSDVGDFFGGGGQDPEAAKARELAAKDAHQYAVEKAEKAAAALRTEMGALHVLTAEYNNVLRTHLDHETRVKRLLVHIRNNIFHYMQAIWSMEPPDQRFLRLHKVQVPVLELAEVPDDSGTLVPDRHYLVQVTPVDDIFASFRAPGTKKHKALMTGKLKPVTRYKPLVQVARLDSPVDCMGNYMIFPLNEHNALTEFMAAPFIDSAFGAMDPDDLSNVSLQDYGRYVCCLHERLPAEQFEAMKPALRGWLEKLLADPLRNGDEITVPTDSLFIEILPGAHSLLENFKLRHRELDVFKAAEDVRKSRLENFRLAARLLHNEREDPDVEKKIVVMGNLPPAIDVDN